MSRKPSARLAAAQLLTEILSKQQPLELAVERHVFLPELAPRDRAFTQLLLKTTLRRKGQIDALLAKWLNAPLPANAALVENSMRLGIAQLLWLQTPPHAAVHSTVEIIKESRFKHLSAMVNAVLQRCVREGAEDLKAYNNTLINIPHWLAQSWLDAYGEDITQSICHTLLTEPPLDISVKQNPEHWAEKLGGTALGGNSVRLNEVESITQLEGFTTGQWWVQDVAASLPVQLLGDMKSKTVLDMCAAPGGKTAQLAANGAQVTALDISKTRMKRVAENMQRLQLHVECVVTDAATYQPPTPPDMIMLDAPCSATGTLRRHPDVAWHRTPKDIARLCALQKKLFHHAADILAVGGQMVYAVCSLQPQEGEQQVETFMHERPDMALLPSPAFDDFKHLVTKNSFGWRSFPSHLPDSGGMDGFFMSVLQKK